MPSVRYYHEQAMALLNWTNEINDPVSAKNLTLRARDIFDLADLAWNQSNNLDAVLDIFNRQQMRGRPKLQQQQTQPRSKED